MAALKSSSEEAALRRKTVQQAFRYGWRAYTYLYYRIYAENLRIGEKSDLPQWNAMFGISALSGLNIMTLVVWSLSVIGVHLSQNSEAKAIIVSGGTIWIYVNYRLLVRNGRYRDIAKAFANESRSKKRIHTILCWIYVVATFASIGIAAELA